MLKVRYWIGVVSAPILLVTAGCSIGPRPFTTTSRGYSPERMMAMGRTFERQGHVAQAKVAYSQVLAMQPSYPDAQESLETLMAGGSNEVRRVVAIQTQVAQSQQLREPALIAETAPRRRAERLDTIAKSARVQPIERIEEQELDLNDDVMPAVAPAKPIVTQRASSTTLPALEEKPAVPRLATITPASPHDTLAAIDEELPKVDYVPVLRTTPAIPELADEPQIAVADEVEASPSAVAETTHSLVEDEQVGSDEPQLAGEPTAEPSVAAGEPEEFLAPLVGGLPVEDPELDQFFGPFNVSMVERLKGRRERFQPQLLRLAVNESVDNDRRSRAIFLIGALGPDASAVVPTLRREIQNDLDPFLRIDLSEALLKIKPEDEDAINVLVSMLREADPNVRWVAAFALRNAVSPRTTFVIESLRSLVQTDDLKLRRMVFLTLAEFGPAAAAVIPDLQAALESPDPGTREVAKACLQCIAPEQPSAVRESTRARLTEFALKN